MGQVVDQHIDIIKNYSNMVFHLALSKTKNLQTAEDVVQETFLRLIKANPTFESEEHIKAWLIRVTINCCNKVWNSAWFRRTTSLKEDISSQREFGERSEVYYAVLELPEKYRILVYLYYYEDMSISQIARTLHMKENTVTTRIHRARIKLKEKLRGDYDYE